MKFRKNIKRLHIRSSRLVKRLAEYTYAQQVLTALIEDNQEVFASFFAAADAYNYALDNAETALRESATRGELPKQLPSGFRVRAGSKAISYDPAKLPEDVRAMPGVIVPAETADKTVIDNLVKAGKLTEEQLAPARVTKVNSPSLSTPDKIAVSLRKNAPTKKAKS